MAKQHQGGSVADAPTTINTQAAVKPAARQFASRNGAENLTLTQGYALIQSMMKGGIQIACESLTVLSYDPATGAVLPGRTPLDHVGNMIGMTSPCALCGVLAPLGFIPGKGSDQLLAPINADWDGVIQGTGGMDIQEFMSKYFPALSFSGWQQEVRAWRAGLTSEQLSNPNPVNLVDYSAYNTDSAGGKQN